MAPLKIVLITPPMAQLNTPYPATPCLAGFLREKGYRVMQADLSLALALKLLSRAGLRAMHEALKPSVKQRSVRFFRKNLEAYVSTISPVIRFLQGRNPRLTKRIITRTYLPEGPRFSVLSHAKHWPADHTSTLMLKDPDLYARYLASLYVDDLADVIHEGVDPFFELSRYAEKLAITAPSFDPLYSALESRHTLTDTYLEQLTRRLLTREKPDAVGLTVPFPGNLYGALRIARCIKACQPSCRIVLGGGYINTELRQLSDPRIFDFVDFITLDDGEMPLLRIFQSLEKSKAPESFCRTFVRRGGRVVFCDAPAPAGLKEPEAVAPDYSGL
ncbi:MAG: radical SAM protein, partial [Lentisphaerota bacterium]